MEPYSLLLLLALVSLGLALIVSLPGRREARLVALVAAVASLASLGVHLATGHRPGTSRALLPVEFALEHPTLMLTLAGGSTLGWWLRRRSSRQ